MNNTEALIHLKTALDHLVSLARKCQWRCVYGDGYVSLNR